MLVRCRVGRTPLPRGTTSPTKHANATHRTTTDKRDCLIEFEKNKKLQCVQYIAIWCAAALTKRAFVCKCMCAPVANYVFSRCVVCVSNVVQFMERKQKSILSSFVHSLDSRSFIALCIHFGFVVLILLLNEIATKSTKSKLKICKNVGSHTRDISSRGVSESAFYAISRKKNLTARAIISFWK